MKNTQKHHTPKRIVKPFNFKNVAMMTLIAIHTFGVKALSFLERLEIVGKNPYESLNRGQLKRMYWLRYVAG